MDCQELSKIGWLQDGPLGVNKNVIVEFRDCQSCRSDDTNLEAGSEVISFVAVAHQRIKSNIISGVIIQGSGRIMVMKVHLVVRNIMVEDGPQGWPHRNQ